MNTLKSMNFGVKGWILLAYQFVGFVAYTVFTNFPMNMLADLFGGAQKLSSLYTTGAVIAIIIQLILSAFIGRIKSIKWVGAIFGIITMIFALCIMVINPLMNPSLMGAWQGCYLMICIFAPMWGTFTISTLVGQWFPTKKGTFMGIATIAFPIVNGLMGSFAHAVFGGGMPNVFGAYLPYYIIILVIFVLGLIVLKDYPEQCGAYRDNNKDITPEIANAMLAQEIENKRTSVWKTGKTMTNRDYWFVTVACGLLLMFSVGTMTQTASIIGSYGAEMDKFGGFAGVMVLIMIFGIIGSIVIGFIDTAIGTKKAMIISCVIMLLSGICGMMGNATATVAALILLAIFMGASSNFTVSAAAQYWRREDFTSIFACLNPVANLMSAIGPMIIAFTMVGRGTFGVFGIICGAGVIGIILMFLFSPKHVKVIDDRRRAKAGKVMDDALVGRK